MALLTDSKISELYLSGQSAAMIAAAMSVSRAAIYRRLARLGVERRRPGRRDLRLDGAAIVATYASGTSLAGLARSQGCHPATIGRLLRAKGVLSRAVPNP